MTSRSVSGSWSTSEAASASNRATVASATERRTASPPAGSRRRAAAARAATSARARAAASGSGRGSVTTVPRRAAGPGRGSRGRRARSGSARARRARPSSRLTDSREPPTMPATSAWVYGQSIRTSAAGAGPSTQPGRGGDPDHEPAAEVEEVERLDVAREPPELARERPDQRPLDPRLGGEQPLEVVPAQHERLGGLHRHDRRGVGLAVEHRQLAEEVAGPQRREDRGLAGVAGDGRTTFTAPDAMTWSASPGSPWWNTVSSRRKRRTRRHARQASRASGSTPSNSTHRASACRANDASNTGPPAGLARILRSRMRTLTASPASGTSRRANRGSDRGRREPCEGR